MPDPIDGKVLRSFDPATGEWLGEYVVDDEASVDEIVELARDATPWWAPATTRERGRCLMRWADRLAADAKELAVLLHRELGIPEHECHPEVLAALERIRASARHAERILRRHRIAAPSPRELDTTVTYRPYGVVGALGSWNDPLWTTVGVIADALAAGNTVVFKPSEFATAVGKFLVDAFRVANSAAYLNVLSIVYGDGRTGAALCRSGLDRVAFLGSLVNARRVLALCAENVVPVHISRSGRGAMIIADDADMAGAVDAAVHGAFGRAEYRIEVVYVVASARARFLEELRTTLERDRGGPAVSRAMKTARAIEIVGRHIDNALVLGATALIGGYGSVRPPFVDPIVLVDPADESLLLTERTPGPVLTVRTVPDVDEAAHLVNRDRSVSSATVSSVRHGTALAERLVAECVVVNRGLPRSQELSPGPLEFALPRCVIGGESGSTTMPAWVMRFTYLSVLRKLLMKYDMDDKLRLYRPFAVLSAHRRSEPEMYEGKA